MGSRTDGSSGIGTSPPRSRRPSRTRDRRFARSCSTSLRRLRRKLASKKLADGRMVSAPLEDLTPLLSREEFAENMLIPPLAE